MKQRINVPFEIKQLPQEEDPNFFRFEGFASTFGNIDLGDDVVMPGAFSESLTKRKPKLLWQHDMDDPLGVFESIEETPQGLKVLGKMPKSDTLVAGRVMPQMKVGSVDSMSIGFSLTDGGWYIKDGVRYITKATLWEISLVTMPMNPEARVTDMKRATTFKNLPLADRARPWDATAAMSRVREFTNSTDAPSARYKDAFFWFDQESPETFGSYKLQFADVIDGRLTAVPRGIFAAAAAMQGARGGVNIPDADRQPVMSHIARYYAKLDMTAPWEKSGYGVEEIEAMSARELEDVLRESGFSRGAAKKMTSKIKSDQRDADTEPDLRDAGSTEALVEGLKALATEFKTK